MQDSNSDSPHSPTDDVESPKKTLLPELVIEATDSFNYAAWQNAVPLLRRVSINNANGGELEGERSPNTPNVTCLSSLQGEVYPSSGLL